MSKKLIRLYEGKCFIQNGQNFAIKVEQLPDGKWQIVRYPHPAYEQPFPQTKMGYPFRYEETAVDAANAFSCHGELPLRTKFSVRQLPSGEWLVFNAIQAKYGIGTYQVGSPAPGYTTGAQFGRHATKDEAIVHAERLAHESDGVVVEFSPPQPNPQFVDLPPKYPTKTEYDSFADAESDGWVHINPSKTLHIHRGKRVFVRDSTPGASFGYEMIICVEGSSERLAESSSIWAEGKFSVRFRSGDVVDAIHAARKFIDSVVE